MAITEVPLQVLKVVSAKYLTPGHDVVSVITPEGELKIFTRAQDQIQFDLVVAHVKNIEPFAREEQKALKTPPAEPAPIPIPEAQVPESSEPQIPPEEAVRTQPAANTPSLESPPVEPLPPAEPAPEPAPAESLNPYEPVKTEPSEG